jgi:hypothetical protein
MAHGPHLTGHSTRPGAALGRRKKKPGFFFWDRAKKKPGFFFGYPGIRPLAL